MILWLHFIDQVKKICDHENQMDKNQMIFVLLISFQVSHQTLYKLDPPHYKEDNADSPHKPCKPVGVLCRWNKYGTHLLI
jgi:hypothetical protein